MQSHCCQSSSREPSGNTANVVLRSVMIKTCDFQPTSLRTSSDDLTADPFFFFLKAACGDSVCLETDKTFLKKLEERVRLQELGQARPPRALSLSKHQLSYHLGEA